MDAKSMNESTKSTFKKKKFGALSIKQQPSSFTNHSESKIKDDHDNKTKQSKYEDSISSHSSSDDDDSHDDHDDGEDEGMDSYRVGGYHPIHVGEVYESKYIILEKLGWGHFSTVWLAYNNKQKNISSLSSTSPSSSTSTSPRDDIMSHVVALKVQKSADHYREAALDEIELLRCISKASKSEAVLKEYGVSYHPPIVALHDHFIHHGPHGLHVCMAFEVLGENLLSLIKKFNYLGIPIMIVKRIAVQVLQGLDFLHRHCSIIHTDLKPENILISYNPVLVSYDRSKHEDIISSSQTSSASASSYSTMMTSSSKTKKTKKTKEKKSSSSSSSTSAMTKKPSSSSSKKADAQHLIDSFEKQMTIDGKPATSSSSSEQQKKLKKKLKRKKQKKNKQQKKSGGKSSTSSSVSATYHGPRSKAPSRTRRPTAENDITLLPSSLSSSSSSLSSSSSSSQAKDILSQDDDNEDSPRSHDHGDRETSTSPTTLQPKDSILSHISIATFLQKNLLTYLNFRTLASPANNSSSSSSSSSVSSPFKPSSSVAPVMISPLASDQYIKPDDQHYTSIPMILPYHRLLKAFGSPSELSSLRFDDVDDDHRQHHALWYLQLPSSSSSSEKISFMIRGRGQDTRHIASLAYKTFIHASSLSTIQIASRSFDSDHAAPIIWDIIHHHHATIHILRAIEQVLNDVRFLCLYDLPTPYLPPPISAETIISISSQAELVGLVSKLSIHTHVIIDDHHHHNKHHRDRDREYRYIMPNDNGSMIGLDISSILQSDTNQAIDVISSTNTILRQCRSIDDRVEFFSMTYDEMMEGLYLDHQPTQLSIPPSTSASIPIASSSNNMSTSSPDHHIHLKPACSDSDSDDDGNNDDISDSDEEEIVAISNPTKDKNSSDKKKQSREELSKLYAHCNVKIVDLGNACWRDKHFTDDIQTREYRSPEVIVGASYDTSADIWSFGCLIFELLTGDLLFDPQPGGNWDDDEDHLALIIELIEAFHLPRGQHNHLMTGCRYKDYFNRKGDLRNIQRLKPWPLREVLEEKYKFSSENAKDISDFLMPLLQVHPDRRSTADQALQHPWIRSMVDR